MLTYYGETFNGQGPALDEDTKRWLITLALAVGGFLLGGGWPWKAYRRMGDLDLVERMRPHFWLRVEQGAFERQNEMRHDRTDEIMKMLHDAQSAVMALSGAVERHTEAIKYFGNDLQEVKDEVEELKRRPTP